MSRKPFQQLLSTTSSQNMILVRSTVSSQHQTSRYEAAEAIALAHTSITERQSLLKPKDSESKIEDMSDKNEQIILLTMEVERLRSMLSNAKEDRTQTEALAEKCMNLERQRDAVYGRILQLEKQMTEDIRRRDDKLEEAYRKIKSMHEANITLSQELTSYRNRYTELQIISDKQQTDCQSKLSILENEYSHIHQQNSRLKQKYESSTQITQSLEQRLEQEKDNYEKHLEIVTMKQSQEARALQDQLRDAKYELSYLKSQITNRSAKEMELLQIQKQEISRISFEKEAEYEEELKKLNRLFREKENSFENQRKSLISNITSLRSQRDRLEKQLFDSESGKQQLEEHIKNNTQYINQNKQQLDHLAQTLSQYQSKCRSNESSIDALSRQKESLIGTINQLQDELERQKAQQSTNTRTSQTINELQYELEVQKKKSRKLQQEVSSYAQKSAAYLKADVENKMLREEVQKLYQTTLDLQDKLRQTDRSSKALCDITFTNRQNIEEKAAYPRDYESMTVTINDKRRVCSLDRRRQSNQKENRAGLTTNPPSAEKTPGPSRQHSVTRLQTFNTNSSVQSQQQNSQPRTIPDFTDPFISDDNNILRNKLSEKNLLPDPNKQAKTSSFRGNYSHSRNMLFEREKMNESILKRCQQLLTANRLARV